MRKTLYLLLILPIVMFVACDADFDPNDDWRENMMVYCLLDQDDDTTYVRIEKCFLGNGNAYDFAKTKDSVYYSDGDLDVKLQAFYTWDTNSVVATYDFQYSERAKNNGDFYSDGTCPVYYCVTKGKLSANQMYKLIITNLKTGTVVTSKAYLLGDYSIETNTFTFTEADGSMKISWSNNYNYTSTTKNSMPKQFAVDIRFNYTESSEIKYVDIPVGKVTNNNEKFSHFIKVDTATILSYLRVKLKGKQNMGWYGTAPFEIRINACDLAMFDYMSINNATQNSLNYTPVYSNIENGTGLFAARRTHIFKSFADKDLTNEFKSKVRELGF